MAESESRLETLEDEVKVLKGEVKRTLVDLRALLMQEDSPLGEGAMARRAAARPDQGLDSDMVREGPTREPDEAASVPTPQQPAEVAPLKNGSRSSEDALLEVGLGLPSSDLPGGPPEGGPGPGPMPAVLPGPFTGDQGDPPNGAAHEPTPLDARVSEADGGLVNRSDRQADQQTLETREGPPVEKAEEGRKSRRPGWPGRPGDTSGEDGPDSSARNGRGGSIYDEYRELLEETRQTHPVEDSPVGPPLDINLLSNLVYWAALAKQRVGEDQLKDILQLYIQSGHSRPELQDLLLQISDMVDPEPVNFSEDPREWVDLMFHLHGILTGGFPVIKLPPIRLSAGDGAGRDQG